MNTAFEPIEGKYEILEKLHDGGMGSIYKVRHRLLDSIRVIKTMKPQLADDEEFKARFLREARVAISLDHPNIAKLYDFSIAAEGMAFIVMEFIPGLSLRQILRGMGPPDLPLTLELARQTLDALGFLHRQGYVHRDVAPDNVMLTSDADRRPRIKLIDLGIAKSLSGGDDLTTAGQFLGKARYSSPEHFAEKGASGTDARSDVYSFGVVLYELLTGRTPIEGADLRSLSAGHLYRPPVPFEDSDADGLIPGDLRRIVLRALEKEPEDRFPDTRIFAEALDHVGLRFPLPELDVDELFEQIRVSGAVVRAYTPHDTQIQLDHQFGQETTPTRGQLARHPELRVEADDLPAPEAIIAKIDEIAGDQGAVEPGAGTDLLPPPDDGKDDGQTVPPGAETVIAQLPELDPALLADDDELRQTQPIDLEELQRTQRIDVETIAETPESPPPDDDDYQTESTFLPAAADPPPAPSASPPSTSQPSASPPSASPPVADPPETETPARRSALAAMPRHQRQLLAAVGAAVLVAVLAAAGVVFWNRQPETDVGEITGRSDSLRAEDGPPPAAPAEGPLVAMTEIHPALIGGRRCLIAGDPICAIIAVNAIEAESLSLAPAELEELLGDLRAGLDASLGIGEAADTRSPGERLVDALENGPVTDLRDAFDAISELRVEDPESFLELDESIVRAGAIVGEWRRMWRLKRTGDSLGVVRTTSRLAELYPPYAARAQAHGSEAAAAIEAQAEALAEDGDLGTARARLAELRQALPDRQGLRQRIAALDGRLQQGREIEAVIARAEDALGVSDPNRGLELLEQISIPDGSRYADQVADLRERLQRRLLDMDREAPTVRELPEEAEYRRNSPATIPLEIEDDYRVENVRAWARGGREGAFSEVTVHHEEASRYVVEVPAAVHDNKRNLEFHVWVADRSGHTATLGTEETPRSVRRKGLF